jgi:DNA helicase HerA-like ATPase
LQNLTNDRQMPSDEENDKSEPRENRHHGRIVDCNGTHAIIVADIDEGHAVDEFWAVGQLISIQRRNSRIVGQTFRVDSPSGDWQPGTTNQIKIHIELVGEIQETEDGNLNFSSGITAYPPMGAVAHKIRASDLEAVYKNSAQHSIQIGHLTQETSIPARIDLDKLLTRHFAVVGSTGVGKSTSVSLMMRKIIKERKDLRILILDPHNEFASSFADDAIVKDANNLQLPFWLFRFDEFAEVIFRGQKGLDVEMELLRDLVAAAKEQFAASGEHDKTVRRLNENKGYTADSPVPYRIMDMAKCIDERLGQLEGKHDKPVLKALKERISTISRDPRFTFMFGQAAAGGDRLKLIISELFRLPTYDKPICIIEMSALPSEVVNSVASVLCRMAFDLAMSSSGGIQTLIVCEEAHRYVPADPDAGFWPTRQAVARIAKEGRKYGVYLSIITQRPSELDPTILSQCNTVFAMRLSNRSDQQIIGGAITNGAQSTVGFLASIQNRECIAFGEALNTPMRLTFETINQELLPGNRIHQAQKAIRAGQDIDLDDVIARMRGGDASLYRDTQFAETSKVSTLPQREHIDGVAQEDNSAPIMLEHEQAVANAHGGHRTVAHASVVAQAEPRQHPPQPQPERQAASASRSGNQLLESFRVRQ